MLIRNLSFILVVLVLVSGCSSSGTSSVSTEDAPDYAPAGSEPPEAIRAWMDRLSVAHEYDPETGFIVARETIGLPKLIERTPALDEVMRRRSGEIVVVFATADRCAPCQQYKKDALNDDRVIARLERSELIATHVEVDRSPELATRYLGSLAIPMTYAFRDGERIAQLRGQRSADELLAWLDELPQD